jgi:hypothetical protein
MRLPWLLYWRLCLFLFLAIAGCTTTPKTSYHSFSFVAFWDSPSVEILDYRYGSKSQSLVVASDDLVRAGLPSGQRGVTAEMPLGEELYVKWRIKSTKEIREQTINLKSLLPADMQGTTIDFTIDDNGISIFVIYEKYKDNAAASLGPRRYQANQVLQIYPTKISNF